MDLSYGHIVTVHGYYYMNTPLLHQYKINSNSNHSKTQLSYVIRSTYLFVFCFFKNIHLNVKYFNIAIDLVFI